MSRRDFDKARRQASVGAYHGTYKPAKSVPGKNRAPATAKQLDLIEKLTGNRPAGITKAKAAFEIDRVLLGQRKARTDVRLPSRLEAQDVACPRCHAPAGDPCIGEDGPREMNHIDRIRAWQNNVPPKPGNRRQRRTGRKRASGGRLRTS